MRVSATQFFSPGAGGLVDEGLLPDPDEAIVNCYRLADRFKQDPMKFLEQPMSQIAIHITYTVKLIDAQRAAREAARAEDED